MTAMTEWEDSTAQTSLQPGDVHVWAWQTGDSIASREPDLSCLAHDEIGRYKRLLFRPDRMRFAISHVNLRRILAGYLGRSPASLDFGFADGGKPTLVGSNDPRLQFSLSHSKDVGLLAVASDLELGIDVEGPRKVKRALAQRYFSPIELQMLSELNDEEWLPGFLRCWTRKEAILKAEGVGLLLSLKAFDVSLKPGDAPALLGVRPPAAFRFPWLLYEVSPAAHSIASLAVSSPPHCIRRFHYRSG